MAIFYLYFSYAADKIRSIGLILTAGILWFSILLLAQRFYVSYIHKALVFTLGFGWPKLINVAMNRNASGNHPTSIYTTAPRSPRSGAICRGAEVIN
jgi:hypothetical protein